MPSVSEIKNTSRAVKQVAEATKDVGAALSFGKALTNGRDSKISNGEAFLMVWLALVLDLTQLGLGLLDGGTISGPAILVFQLGLFSLWFWLKGLNYWTTRATASKVVSGIAELIPVLNDFVPGTTINVVVALAFVRMEEAGLKQEQGQGQQKPNNVREPRKPGPDPKVKTPARVGTTTNPLRKAA